MAKKRKQPSVASNEVSEDLGLKKARPIVIKKIEEKDLSTESEPVKAEIVPKSTFKNKEKVLVLCARGLTFRYRHLMEDLILLLPHCKKDAKIEKVKQSRAVNLNECADLKNCSSCLYFEGRKGLDLFMWASKTPNGPSAKFQVNAVHTMGELKLTGNHLKGSRPLLIFSSSFDDANLPHLKLIKEMFTQIFSTPFEHRKSKPFFDHVISFTALDKHIWFRNYQITFPNINSVKFDKPMLEKMTLVEVGPRFCLNPIKIFSNSFGGQTIYENPFFVSANKIRSIERKKRMKNYGLKVKKMNKRKDYVTENAVQPDEFSEVWKE